MNKQIRRAGYSVLILFGALFVNLNWIQLVKAEKLANHPANTRLLLKEYALERGAVLSSDGQTLAISRPTPEARLKYLRTYDTGDLFAHVVGYYSIRFGRDRLERSMNKELSGRGGVITMQDLGDRLLGKGERGDTIVITIDSRVQTAARDALSGHKGAVVAIDPVNGEVLAMVSLPSFDPNPLSQHSSEGQEQSWNALNADPSKPLLNRATLSTYPPGSTFKVLTAAAAIQNGKGGVTYPSSSGFTPEQTNREIRNFGGGSCGGDLADALRVSCNTYFARLGAELGGEALSETARSFGFDEAPPFDIRTTRSRMPSPDALRSPAFSAQSAIGQFDVAATPLQMALVAAGVGNNGKVPVPRLVKEVRDARRTLLEQTKSEMWKEALIPEVAAQLKSMMIQVVKSGTGTRAAVDGVEVAGKTGTAQFGVEGRDTIAWFIGFAPANNPRIAVAVVVEGAGDSRNETGGRLAAPIAGTLIDAHRKAAGW